jgi:hypothetical protein
MSHSIRESADDSAGAAARVAFQLPGLARCGNAVLAPISAEIVTATAISSLCSFFSMREFSSAPIESTVRMTTADGETVAVVAGAVMEGGDTANPSFLILI